MTAAVVAEARRWIGTPSVDQQTVRGAGCDCLGLVRGVWRAVVGPGVFLGLMFFGGQTLQQMGVAQTTASRSSRVTRFCQSVSFLV